MNKIPLNPSCFRRREKKPLYARLQARLQELIETKYWKPNEQIPPERELAAAAGVSISTVKIALQNLVLAGYLHRRQGSGTFVASLDAFFGLNRYFGMQKDFDIPRERYKISIISRKSVICPNEIGRYFMLGENVETHRMERLFYFGGGKTVHTTSWLPKDLFSNFDTEISDHIIEEKPLYLLLASVFNCPCRGSKELLSVVPAPAHVASALDIKAGASILYSKLMAFSYNDTVFEIRESYIVTGTLQLYREF